MGQGSQREGIREGEGEGEELEQRRYLLFIEAVSGIRSLFSVEKANEQVEPMLY